MRVALVSPYSYTYPGGVGRHVEGLTAELERQGHEVRLLAPYDPDDRHARIAHRGARPEPRPIPDGLVPIGRTIGLGMNGAVSNLALSPSAAAAIRRELRRDYDVVHVHEPNVPIVSWVAAEHARAPLVGTFHTYSTSHVANGLAAGPLGARRIYNKLHVRIAVSEAARWTARRFYGGRYRIVPNGIDLNDAPAGTPPASDTLRLLFVGRAENRKGLPIALRAYEALRSAGLDVSLTVAGATAEEVEPLLVDASDVDVRGRVSEDEKWRLLHESDILCAPSLGGESFGIVLAEAFAAGTPVVCSDIAGYRDVVRDGYDGVLVPPGDPAALASTLRELGERPEELSEMAAAARGSARRFSWPIVTDRVLEAYDDARRLAAERDARAAMARRAGGAALLGERMRRGAERAGFVSADGGPPAPPSRAIAPIEPPRPRAGRRRPGRAVRRVATAAGALAAVGLGALAINRIGASSILDALLAAAPVWVLVAFALMCASMLMRAEAWTWILRAALPGTSVRRRDAARGTMIGVLMSATLPARLGEPSRAFIVARRLGRVRERLPVVLGTLISQTILNIFALVILGSVMFATVGLFQGNEDKLVFATIAPLALLTLVLVAPVLLRRGGRGSERIAQAIRAVRGAMVEVRRGLVMFRRPRIGAWAATAQLSAWALQWLACYALLVALGLDGRAGIGAAAAVLFAVNVTAVLPVTPSNIGVFQAACIAVLSAYGVGHTDAFAYGIILQAVEVATAIAMGMPALVREGMTWSDMRMRALHGAPIELPGARRAEPAEAEL